MIGLGLVKELSAEGLKTHQTRGLNPPLVSSRETDIGEYFFPTTYNNNVFNGYLINGI